MVRSRTGTGEARAATTPVGADSAVLGGAAKNDRGRD